jgi:predicted AAA+ superfamily ATPase
MISHSKLFLFDAGIFRTLRPRGPLDRPEEIDGAAVESLVAQHLRAWIAYRGTDAELFFWRTQSGVEVDFVVYGKAGFWAIEVKNTARVRAEDLRGLEAFVSDYPQAEALLLYRGTRHERRGPIWILPVEEFYAIFGQRPGFRTGGEPWPDTGSSRRGRPPIVEREVAACVGGTGG